MYIMKNGMGGPRTNSAFSQTIGEQIVASATLAGNIQMQNQQLQVHMAQVQQQKMLQQHHQ